MAYCTRDIKLNTIIYRLLQFNIYNLTHYPRASKSKPGVINPSKHTARVPKLLNIQPAARYHRSASAAQL